VADWRRPHAYRELALFNPAMGSKLRGCGLVKLKAADVFASGQAKEPASCGAHSMRRTKVACSYRKPAI